MRKKIRPKRDDVIGNWRRLHKEELHDQVWETGLRHSEFL